MEEVKLTLDTILPFLKTNAKTFVNGVMAGMIVHPAITLLDSYVNKKTIKDAKQTFDQIFSRLKSPVTYIAAGASVPLLIDLACATIGTPYSFSDDIGQALGLASGLALWNKYNRGISANIENGG